MFMYKGHYDYKSHHHVRGMGVGTVYQDDDSGRSSIYTGMP